MISELILKKRMIKGEIEINRDSISKSKETLLQESSRKADPAQKEILSTLLSFYLNWELKQIEGFNKSISKDLQFYKSLSHLLNITPRVFDNQRNLRDELYWSLKHNYKEEASNT